MTWPVRLPKYKRPSTFDLRPSLFFFLSLTPSHIMTTIMDTHHLPTSTMASCHHTIITSTMHNITAAAAMLQWSDDDRLVLKSRTPTTTSESQDHRHRCWFTTFTLATSSRGRLVATPTREVVAGGAHG